MSSNNLLTIIGGSLLLGLVATVGALAFHGSISGTDALGFFGGIVALAGGILAHALGVSSGASAASPDKASKP